MSADEMEALVAEEENRLGVGSREFMARHIEIMEALDTIERRGKGKDAAT